jgi:hypothetical protein
MRSEHLDRRGASSSALLGSETRKIAAGRFPGHAFVETLPEHQVSLPLPPRLALDMLRGCAYLKRVSSLRTRVLVRPLGHEENTDVDRPSVRSHAPRRRYLRIVKGDSTFRFK